jgi:hypothetical protein
VKAFAEHVSADNGEEDQSNPGYECLKRVEHLHNRVNTDPSDHGHEELEEGESPGYTPSLPPIHIGIGQGVGNRDRKGIHSQSDSEQDTVKYKNEN